MSDKLKILQVASSLKGWGGLEFHIVRLSKALAQRGHSVCVVCPADSFVQERCASLELPVKTAYVRRHEDFKALGRLREIVREEQPSVMHVHGDNDAVVPVLAARLEHVPVAVLTRHLPGNLKRLFRLFLVNDLLCDRIIGVSDFLRGRLIAQGLRPDRVITIHNSADPPGELPDAARSAALREGLGIDPTHVVAGMVGRLDPEKGIDDFVDAIGRLRRLPISAVIVGAGNEEKAIRDRIAANDLESRVIVAGFRDDAKEIMAAMDIFVLASTWDEPFATVVLEAMLLGKPVVGTRTGGTIEQVVDGATGYLVDPADPAGLAEAIGRLAVEPYTRAQFGERGRVRAESLFTTATMARNIEQLYGELLEASTGGRS